MEGKDWIGSCWGWANRGQWSALSWTWLGNMLRPTQVMRTGIGGVRSSGRASVVASGRLPVSNLLARKPTAGVVPGATWCLATVITHANLRKTARQGQFGL